MQIAIIITVGLVLMFGMPIRLLIDLKKKEKYNYQCQKCFHIFDMYEKSLTGSYRSNGRIHVKCPKCGKYSIVKLIRKEGEL